MELLAIVVFILLLMGVKHAIFGPPDTLPDPDTIDFPCEICGTPYTERDWQGIVCGLCYLKMDDATRDGYEVDFGVIDILTKRERWAQYYKDKNAEKAQLKARGRKAKAQRKRRKAKRHSTQPESSP